MMSIQDNTSYKSPESFLTVLRNQGDNWPSVRLFSRLSRFILFATILTIAYWLFIASDRYVSEASVIIRKTDSLATPAFDVSMLIAGVPSVNRGDQLLLREYLLSVDMLKKLDAQLNLKAHYSSTEHDLFSRLWFTDMEWFHRYYLSRIAVDYDDYAGVLRIKAQAYDKKTAQAIAIMLVSEGERYMNQLSHELAQTQVDFLTNQVDLAQSRFQQASQQLLAFQNEKGLLSPQATAESLNVVIAKLEGQRAQVQTQLAALPRNLNPDHPNIVMLRQSLAAIDRQITEERAKLANPFGQTLNLTMEEFQRLQMEVTFTQELYKAALTALEKGRMDATRMLEKVSVLQAPTLPEYPMEPRRIYNSVITLLFGLMLVGIFKLLESIVLDHVE
jgi:capsular polysaccharide transport system permease protein